MLLQTISKLLKNIYIEHFKLRFKDGSLGDCIINNVMLPLK